jgi:bifunctional UDP-N-acetylglucosamine pyrophosphorylase/glucosamine-1-phosphate N-acetyltransferase
MKTIAVVLAAGKGTRMRSDIPKVLHPLMGKPIFKYAIESAQAATDEKPVMVVGHGADRIKSAAGDSARFVLQEPQLGTGHALLQTRSLLEKEADLILLTTADMPLLSVGTLQSVIDAHQQAARHSPAPPITLLFLKDDNTRGFGRIVRGADGSVQAIIEEKHAAPKGPPPYELNTSVYCFTASWLWEYLPRIPLSSTGEYYLTDLVSLAAQDGYPVQALPIQDAEEAIGINNRLHLAEAEAVLRRRINEQWMLSGVTIIDPQTTYIEPDVQIGKDTVVWPNSYLHGSTRVGESCVIGPNSLISDTQIGNRCRVLFSMLEKAILEDDVEVGPFARLRRGAHLARGVHMGNFGEIKNAYLGPGTKMGHFSYIGDATIGAGVNIGAGTITCNYDGEQKHHTEIESGAFIGSDTMLVAPVKIGSGASTGAGAVVTKDIPPDTLAVGMPARVIRKKQKRE